MFRLLDKSRNSVCIFNSVIFFTLMDLIANIQKSKIQKNRINYTDTLSYIVVKFHDHLDLPYCGAKEINNFFLQDHTIPWSSILSIFPGIRINKFFTTQGPEEIARLVNKARRLDTNYQSPNFVSYFAISCPGEINTNDLLEFLGRCENVELAYVTSDPSLPPYHGPDDNPLCRYQGYLNPAPEGINAKYAWSIPGGKGDGEIKFVDIEQGWLVDHEDIVFNTLPLTGFNHNNFQDHGTAVLGVIMMQDNATGGIGITPMVKGYVISQWRPDGSPNTADAIISAACHLDCGDVLLLETQAYEASSVNKFWPVETEDATYNAIRLATALGIIVIEAGGNGNRDLKKGNNLDAFTVDGKQPLNPMSSTFRDSGAIIVAAASSTVPHKRINYSNYGSRVDCYAWGEGVVTAGCLPGSSGEAINKYTGKFSGTSSASAIIAGVAIAVQSITETNHNFRLSPKQMRGILSHGSNGTPSANGSSVDKIGVMPDLKKIIDTVLNDTKNTFFRNKIT